jgi:hypothetical protein
MAYRLREEDRMEKDINRCSWKKKKKWRGKVINILKRIR